MTSLFCLKTPTFNLSFFQVFCINHSYEFYTHFIKSQYKNHHTLQNTEIDYGTSCPYHLRDSRGLPSIQNRPLQLHNYAFICTTFVPPITFNQRSVFQTSRQLKHSKLLAVLPHWCFLWPIDPFYLLRAVRHGNNNHCIERGREGS